MVFANPPRSKASATIRAHLLRFLGGDLGGPLRILPQDSVARAKPTLETGHSSAIDVSCDALLRLPRENVPRSSAGFAGATIPGGRFGRGAKPPSDWNVQGVRLARGSRAPPCSWALLVALASLLPREEWAEKGPEAIDDQSIPFGGGMDAVRLAESRAA